MKNIIETEVWCKLPEQTDKALQQLGINNDESTDIWCAMSIDFLKVDAIKRSVFDEFIGDNRAVIYLPYDCFTVNMKYEEAVEIWRKS